MEITPKICRFHSAFPFTLYLWIWIRKILTSHVHLLGWLHGTQQHDENMNNFFDINKKNSVSSGKLNSIRCHGIVQCTYSSIKKENNP